MKLKMGRFSKKEVAFIKGNVEKLTVEEISKKLCRSVDSVYDWIERNVGFSEAEKKEVEVNNELKSKPYYMELTHQFSPEELRMFEFHFKKMWSQFRDDVFHTEEMQIVDTIKLEILMNRILRQKQATVTKISDIDWEISREKELGEDGDLAIINNLERQRAALVASQEVLSKDYKELQSRKAAMLKELKGTRQQRIQEIESSKDTFASLIKNLTTDINFRKEVGLEMEKMRIAAEKERARLSSLIKYEDDRYDRPLLNGDSVLQDD